MKVAFAAPLFELQDKKVFDNSKAKFDDIFYFMP